MLFGIIMQNTLHYSQCTWTLVNIYKIVNNTLKKAILMNRMPFLFFSEISERQYQHDVAGQTLSRIISHNTHLLHLSFISPHPTPHQTINELHHPVTTEPAEKKEKTRARQQAGN